MHFFFNEERFLDPQFLFFFLKRNFILFYLFLVALGLPCCTRASSSCHELGLLCSCGVWASHCCGFSCCGAWVLGVQASVVVTHQLS